MPRAKAQHCGPGVNRRSRVHCTPLTAPHTNAPLLRSRTGQAQPSHIASASPAQALLQPPAARARSISCAMGTWPMPCGLRATRALAAVLLVAAIALPLAPLATAQYVECPSAPAVTDDSVLVILEPGETVEMPISDALAYLDVAAQVRCAAGAAGPTESGAPLVYCNAAFCKRTLDAPAPHRHALCRTPKPASTLKSGATAAFSSSPVRRPAAAPPKPGVSAQVTSTGRRARSPCAAGAETPSHATWAAACV